MLAGVWVASVLLYGRLPKDELWEYHFLLALLPVIVLLWWKGRQAPRPIFEAIRTLGVHSTNIFFIHNFFRE